MNVNDTAERRSDATNASYVTTSKENMLKMLYVERAHIQSFSRDKWCVVMMSFVVSLLCRDMLCVGLFVCCLNLSVEAISGF
jgi:hypothetical protein